MVACLLVLFTCFFYHLVKQENDILMRQRNERTVTRLIIEGYCIDCFGLHKNLLKDAETIQKTLKSVNRDIPIKQINIQKVFKRNEKWKRQ